MLSFFTPQPSVNEYGEPIDMPSEDDPAKPSPRRFSSDAKALEHLKAGKEDAEQEDDPQMEGADWERQVCIRGACARVCVRKGFK